MASAGSLEPLGRYGVAGLPTVTLLSADCARASVGTAGVAVTASDAAIMAERRIIAGHLPMLSCVVFCAGLGSITPQSGKAQARETPVSVRGAAGADCHGGCAGALVQSAIVGNRVGRCRWRSR